MEERPKINSDKSNCIIQKKVYQNPFKTDIIYKTNKIKTKNISKIKKDNLFTNSRTIKKLSQIATEKNKMNQSLKKDRSIKHFYANANILNLNKTNYLNKNERKVDNISISIDFKKNSPVIKRLTETKKYGYISQETKTIFDKNKGKNIFENNSNINYRNKNFKSINNFNNKINTESTLNLLNFQKLTYLNKQKFQNDLSTTFKKTNLNIDYSNKAAKIKRILKEKICINDKKNIRNFKNNLIKAYKSDVNILTNRTNSKNKLNNNKKIGNFIHKKLQSQKINYKKINKEINQKILKTEKNNDDIIKGFNYTIIANSKSANTKPTNISSFVISEKKFEQIDDTNNDNKIKEKNQMKSTYFKEHMKYLDFNTNQMQVLLIDNYSKTKESDSKFLNYELGQTNGLSITDSLFCSLENSYKNEKNKNKVIECEHSIEYMEKFANEILNSNKNLPYFLKDKKIKDSYCDMTDNNLSSLDEFKNGENIQRIINLQINLKK